MSLEQKIKDEARRLGFILAGVTSPDPPPHVAVFEGWLSSGRHGEMGYLAQSRSRTRRANPRETMPECKSIIVLAAPYSNPGHPSRATGEQQDGRARGRVAAYAWGQDYHDVLLPRLKSLVRFIETQLGGQISSRCYTDTGPILERDLAQRAGLGWIGKNTCLINPRLGSYLLLAEILVDVELRSDESLRTDHCGTCTRCIDACPTTCILADRTIDARRCISYLTIELKGSIEPRLRPLMDNWIFGCDVCQLVCPWNRFAPPYGDDSFAGAAASPAPILAAEMQLTPEDFRRKFGGTAIQRAKHGGYLRNVAVAIGNTAGTEALAPLRYLAERGESLVREHAGWALEQIAMRIGHNA